MNLKNSMDNKVLEMYEDMALEQLSSNQSFDSTFSASKSNVSGIVTYYMDGFEGYDINNLSADDFDKTKYTKEMLKKSDVVESGKPIYKIIDDENWKIAVMLTKKKNMKKSKRTKQSGLQSMIHPDGYLQSMKQLNRMEIISLL